MADSIKTDPKNWKCYFASEFMDDLFDQLIEKYGEEKANEIIKTYFFDKRDELLEKMLNIAKTLDNKTSLAYVDQDLDGHYWLSFRAFDLSDFMKKHNLK